MCSLVTLLLVDSVEIIFEMVTFTWKMFELARNAYVSNICDDKAICYPCDGSLWDHQCTLCIFHWTVLILM